MADTAHVDETSELADSAPARRSENFALAVAKVLLNRAVPERDAILFFATAAMALLFSASFFLEETMAKLGWGLILSGYGVETPTGFATFLLVGTIATNRL